MANWKEFYFEGNLYWGWIKNEDDWENLKQAYKGQCTANDLFRAKSRVDDPTMFGFYAEYNQDYTLGDFIKENNISLDI